MTRTLSRPTRGRSRRLTGLAVALGVVVLVATAGIVWYAWSSSLDEASTRSITVSTPEGDRTVLVHHPSSAGPRAPLVLVLHAANSTAADSERFYGWDALARREGFVVAYPDALDDKRWNAGTCCRRTSAVRVDDVAFLHEMRARLVAEEDVDPARVFSVGISNGGMMSYAWACARPGDLAGIGVVSGSIGVDCPSPKPLTVVAVHGTADPVFPMGGGKGPFPVPYPPLDEVLAPFRAAAGCAAEPAVQTDGPATVATWQCEGGHTVVRDVLAGSGHTWPGLGATAGTDAGPRDATGFLWSRLRSAPPAAELTH